jgi:hypothetical protein
MLSIYDEMKNQEEFNQNNSIPYVINKRAKLHSSRKLSNRGLIRLRT